MLACGMHRMRQGMTGMLSTQILATTLAWLVGFVLVAVFVVERLTAWWTHAHRRKSSRPLGDRRPARQLRLATSGRRTSATRWFQLPGDWG